MPAKNDLFESGPESDSPLPAFFYFALSGHESLTLDPFNQPVQYLKDSPIRVYSWTLPGHGSGLNPNDAMSFWYQSWERGEDPLEPFLEESLKNIESLIAEGKVDPSKMAVGGLSRGGYASIRLASLDERIKTIAVYAPLIEPSRLDEFHLKTYGPLFTHIPKLVGKKLWASVGNYDTRIGTESVFKFIHTLARANIEEGLRGPEVLLNIKPSIGYKGHGTAPATFKEGIEWLKKKML